MYIYIFYISIYIYKQGQPVHKTVVDTEIKTSNHIKRDRQTERGTKKGKRQKTP